MSETTPSPIDAGFLVVNKPERQATAQSGRQWRMPGFVLRLLSPLALLLLWELASQTGLLPVRVIAAPSQIGGTLWSMILSGELGRHLWVSLQRALLGLSIGVSIGVAAALITGLSKRGEIASIPRCKCCAPFPRWRWCRCSSSGSVLASSPRWR